MFSACAQAAPDCARPGVICAGLVTDSGTISTGIAAQAWLGLADAKANGLLDRIDYIETVDRRDNARNIATLANEGYGSIVTVGSSLADDTRAAAKKYPKIRFIGVQQSQPIPISNLAGLVFHEDQGGFRAGALAALITRTKEVGAVCESNLIDALRRYCDGFRAGAQSVSSAVEVSVLYRNGPPGMLPNDPNWGRAAAGRLVAQGADVIFAAGDVTEGAALEAAAAHGSLVIGSETDQSANLMEFRPQLLTSAIDEIRPGIVDLMREAQAGQFPAGDFFGQVSLTPFQTIQPQITSSILAQLDTIRLGLENGSIQTEIPYQIP